LAAAARGIGETKQGQKGGRNGVFSQKGVRKTTKGTEEIGMGTPTGQKNH